MRNFAFQGAQPSLGNDLVSTTRYLTFAENGVSPEREWKPPLQ